MGKDEQPAKDCFEDHFYGSVTVGERGQIVIPADARKRYGIETGDKLLVMGSPNQKGLVIFKIDSMRQFMTAMLENLQRMEAEHTQREESSS